MADPDVPDASPLKGQASIVIAIIGLVSSVAVALVNRAQVKSDTKSAVETSLERRFANLRGIHMQSGSFEGINSLAGWTLDKAPLATNQTETTPPRIYETRILFNQEFSAVPSVIADIRALDVAHEANTRVLVYPTNIDTKGFTLKIQTWSDSRVYDVVLDWIAYQQ